MYVGTRVRWVYALARAVARRFARRLFFLSALTTLRICLLVLRCFSVPDEAIPRCREVKA